MKRVIQNAVETVLAQRLITSTIRDGDRVAVDVGASGLTFRSQAAATEQHAATAH